MNKLSNNSHNYINIIYNISEYNTDEYNSNMQTFLFIVGKFFRSAYKSYYIVAIAKSKKE